MIVSEGQGDWADQSWAEEQKTKRYRYWSMLRSAKNEFLRVTNQEYIAAPAVFYHYLKQHYGLQVETIDGKVTEDYAVVNEKKYLLFLMKFGS
jgi:hypothetical protein